MWKGRVVRWREVAVGRMRSCRNWGKGIGSCMVRLGRNSSSTREMLKVRFEDVVKILTRRESREPASVQAWRCVIDLEFTPTFVMILIPTELTSSASKVVNDGTDLYMPHLVASIDVRSERSGRICIHAFPQRQLHAIRA